MTHSPRPWTVRQLFSAALSQPAAERLAFVHREAGADANLADRVVSLLSAHEREGQSEGWSATLAGVIQRDLGVSARMPEHIGEYRVVRALGEGGAGSVYECDQPLGGGTKRVAVKRLHLRSRARKADLEREVNALLRMKHSGIATILSAGEDAEGRSYLAMEYVEGKHITKHCEEERVSLRGRLELVQELCEAVAHAHQKRVVHRDLKPANVLVSRPGSGVSVKVVDFGLSSTSEGGGVDGGDSTGTPNYIAPEQAAGDDVDTSADVYSIGAILSELLCGKPMYDPGEVQRIFPTTSVAYMRAWSEHVRTHPAALPSERLASDGAALAAVAAGMGVRRGSLLRLLREDLDWVVRKATAPDPKDRYGGALELAADLRRYARNELLVAKRAGLGERLRKWVRRNPAVSATMATVLAGAVVAGWLAVAEAEARQLAQQSEQRALASERTAAQRAEENARLAAEKGRTVEQFQQVSAVVRLKAAQAAQAALWLSEDDRQGWPAKVEALEAWLAGPCAELLAQRPQLEATVAALRQQALPPTPEQVEAERRSSPQYAEYERQVQLVESLRSGSNSEEAAAMLQSAAARLAELESAVNERRTWTFASDTEGEAAGFLHGVLMDQLGGLNELEAKAKSDVELRLRWARQLGALPSNHPRAQVTWAAVREALTKADGVVASPLYAGRPIVVPDKGWVGLVPIGMNPLTKLWEFYDLRSAWDGQQAAAEIAIPEHRGDGTIEVTESTGILFVLLPGGEVTLGSQDQDPQDPFYVATRTLNLRALRQSSLEPFFLSRYELTQGQWSRLQTWDEVLRLASTYGAGSDNYVGGRITAVHPVENVDWYTSRELLSRYGLRLPSQDEWEYGCRGGTTTPWQVGLEVLMTVANVSDQTAKRAGAPWGVFERWDDGHVVHAPVGSFLANTFGLHDMHGNVAEWCRDELQSTAGTPVRVRRGGNFGLVSLHAQSCYILDIDPTGRNSFLGLRPARTSRL